MGFGFMSPSPWLQSLEGKHVLITGGSSGIGLAIAKEALSQGAFITVLVRSSTKLEKAEQNLAKVGGTKNKILTKIADVGVCESLAKAIRESLEWRAFDVLVCNAGVAKSALLGEGRIEDMHAIIQTNLTGVVNTLHVWIPLMKQRSNPQTPINHSHELTVSNGMYLLYGNSVYGATKYGLKGLGETLKLELMSSNIRISIIFPGYVETAMLGGLEDNKDILEIIKITNFYDRSQAETAEDVARYTLEAIKNGTFLVTSKFNGLLLSTLSRGPMPAETFGRALIELILYIPIRIFTFFAACYIYYVIKDRNQKK